MKQLSKQLRSLFSILACGVALLLAGQAHALESLAWQASGPGSVTATPDSGPADAMIFDYSLSGSAVWSQQTWTFSATAPKTETLNFAWNYTGFHAWYAVYANAVAYADGPNGRTYVNLYTRNGGDAWNESGTASLQLNAGYGFGFIVEGRNFDSDARLLGTLKITRQKLELEKLAWQTSGLGTVSATPDSGPADAMSFDYSLSGWDVWSRQTWTFSATSPETTTLNFAWNYNGFHAWYAVYANAMAYADGPNGRTYVTLYTRNGGDAWSVNGTASLQVHAGYGFGFIVEGNNFDSDARLLGTLKITQN